MPEITDMAALEPPAKEFLDLTKAEVLRQRTSPVDRSYSKLEVETGMKGPPGPEHSLPAPAAVPLTDAVAPSAPAASPAVIVPVAPASPAPTSDSYPQRVNDRINKLWGQKQEAQEYAARLEAQNAELARRLSALETREAGRPYTNQNPYESSGLVPSQSSPPPAGDFISRAEMQAMLAQQGRGIAEFLALQTQHTAARNEAEREFPDVFQRPEARAAYDQIWTSDPYLQRDPNGPVKAAALVRGFLGADPRSAPAQPSADVQKQVLAGVGPSVAQGSAPANAQELRFKEALARAAQTQNPSDLVRARMISLGLA